MSPKKLLILGVLTLFCAPASWAQEAPAGEPTGTLLDLMDPGSGAAAPVAEAEIPTEPAPAAPAPQAEPTAAAETAEAVPDAGVAEAEASLPATGSADAAVIAEDVPAPAEELAVPAAPAPSDLSGTDELAPLEDLAPVAEEVPAEAPPMLGAVGYDSEGRQGRIHVVQSRDTLWDISEAYLGTPWVWPSIWQDNTGIENPHLIHPGDLIWISSTEMRRITPEEAEALLAAGPPPASAGDDVPVAFEEEADFPMAPPEMPVVPEERRSVRVASRESTGLITAEQLDASASIVSRLPLRVMLSQEDDVYIGLGESDVEEGDQFVIFRTHEKVFDPDTGELLGYHVEVLGWLEVDETYEETSMASIRMSTADVQEGDRLLAREPLPADISVQESPQGVEGKITYFPHNRVLMGQHDFVYLNRGTVDGLEVGSPLEVYRPGYAADEITRRERVDVPDRVVASLLVVRANSEASVALVTRAEGELKMGDRFRGAGM